ncbi:MAG: hypothetical protein ACP5N2_01580 [Candidatus Nanoarchaeia archaeon]
MNQKFNQMRDFTLGAIVNTIYQNLRPYAIATDRNLRKESDELSDNVNCEFVTGAFLGGIPALCGLAYQADLYFENPKYLAIPIATNIASIIFEKYKKRKNSEKTKD